MKWNNPNLKQVQLLEQKSICRVFWGVKSITRPKVENSQKGYLFLITCEAHF